MPADTEHQAVSKARKKWKLVRDCVAGPFSVKAAAETYLPKMERQSQKEYDGYRDRAVFFNATKRTHRAINGLIHRKPPTMKLAGPLADIETDADLRGNKLLTYCKTVTNEVSSVGRCGTLVDWSDSEQRAYFAFYVAEDIINWRYTRINGKAVLTLLSLHESVCEDDPLDPFAPKHIEQWRTFHIAKPGAPVVCQIWRHKSDTDKELTVHVTVPYARKGKPLDRIPFAFHNAEGGDPDVGETPLEDLAHVNVSHYQSSADLENGRHLTGNPTPYGFGLNKETDTGAEKPQGGIGDDGTIKLGSRSFLQSDNHEAVVGYLEFEGKGLETLENAMKQKEEQMAGLGARLIEPRQTDAESFETVALRANAESSTLAQIGINCTATLKQALAWVIFWTDATAELDKAEDGIEFALNSDFTAAAITPEMLTAAGAARQANLISAKAYFYQLQRGEFFPPDWTEEEELEAIESKPLMPPPVPVDPNKIDPETGKPFPPAPKPAPKPAAK